MAFHISEKIYSLLGDCDTTNLVVSTSTFYNSTENCIVSLGRRPNYSWDKMEGYWLDVAQNPL